MSRQPSFELADPIARSGQERNELLAAHYNDPRFSCLRLCRLRRFSGMHEQAFGPGPLTQKTKIGYMLGGDGVLVPLCLDQNQRAISQVEPAINPAVTGIATIPLDLTSRRIQRRQQQLFKRGRMQSAKVRQLACPVPLPLELCEGSAGAMNKPLVPSQFHPLSPRQAPAGLEDEPGEQGSTNDQHIPRNRSNQLHRRLICNEVPKIEKEWHHMSYVEEVLLDGETLLAEAKTHWFIYCWPTSLGLFSLALAGLDFVYPGIPLIMAGAFGVATIGYYLRAWLYVYSTELAVTNKRIIAKTGLIARDTIELRNEKIESIHVVQSIPGRIFGYGSVYVAGSGGTTAPIIFIKDPLRFRSAALTGLDAGDRGGNA